MAAKNAKTYVIAGALLALGVGYLLYTGLTEGSAYFLNVSEAMAMDKAKLNQVRLFGNVDEAGMEKPGDRLGVVFQLMDKENPAQIIRVDFRGAVPDTFKPGAEVIVEGGFKGEVFHAQTLMTKCPSKYEKQNRA